MEHQLDCQVQYIERVSWPAARATGLPTSDNVHEVAQVIVPSARVVYVENDPLVLAHARALLTSSEEGRTAYIHADLRSPDEILSSPVVREVLDFSQPAALMLVGTLHFLEDKDEPERIIATLLGALPPGSYLTASHLNPEHDRGGAPWTFRLVNSECLTGSASPRASQIPSWHGCWPPSAGSPSARPCQTASSWEYRPAGLRQRCMRQPG
jgi:S-adenosyl methyltransferase